jgi:peptidoglycan/xylan/chitin deacetylase (PgdA/CDA1 family)
MSPFALTSLVALTVLASASLLMGPSVWLAAVCGVVVAAYLAVMGLGVANPRMGFFLRMVCRGAPGEKQVALTFDDGPDPQTTLPLLDLLEKHKVKASFFLVGKKVDDFPSLAQAIAQAGHTIGNHTFHHYWWTNFLWGKPLSKEVTLTQDAIARATGQTPHWYRPPVGLSNPHLGRVLKKAGLTCIGWDIRSGDRKNPANAVMGRIMDKTRDGSIVLLHDGGVDVDQLLELVEQLIIRLRGIGYSLVSLDNMMHNLAGEMDYQRSAA